MNLTEAVMIFAAMVTLTCLGGFAAIYVMVRREGPTRKG